MNSLRMIIGRENYVLLSVNCWTTWSTCGVLVRLSWILLIRWPQTQTVDRSRYKLRITTSYNHLATTKNAVPRIWEGDGMEHRHTISNKSQRETLATKAEYNDNRNIENRQYQHPMHRVQNYLIIFFDVSLTDQLPITVSSWHVSNTKVLGRALIGTCVGHPQITEFSHRISQGSLTTPNFLDRDLND